MKLLEVTHGGQALLNENSVRQSLRKTVHGGILRPNTKFDSLRMLLRRFIVVFGLVASAACNRGASITIRNESAIEVQDVRVEGRCFAEGIGNLAPGAARAVRVKPCGESSARVRFIGGGSKRESPELGYIEADSFYSITLTIGPDFTVRDYIR